MYTQEALDALTKEKLVKLGRYIGVRLNMKMLKGDMIEAILNVQKPKVVEEEPPMSVRVKRIQELNRSK